VSLADWFLKTFAPPPHATRPSELPVYELRDDIKRVAKWPIAPTRDEFVAWRADPTTRFLVAALIRNADECADQWHQLSWVGGNADQRTLDGLRERADTLRGIAEADYDALCEVLGLEPEKEERAA
jgi:hypothetical protein